MVAIDDDPDGVPSRISQVDAAESPAAIEHVKHSSDEASNPQVMMHSDASMDVIQDAHSSDVADIKAVINSI